MPSTIFLDWAFLLGFTEGLEWLLAKSYMSNVYEVDESATIILNSLNFLFKNEIPLKVITEQLAIAIFTCQNSVNPINYVYNLPPCEIVITEQKTFSIKWKYVYH